MISAIPTLTVSAIFLAWNLCRRERARRDRLLRERVAHMLWVAATDDDNEPEDDDGNDDGPPDNDLERRLTGYALLHRR